MLQCRNTILLDTIVNNAVKICRTQLQIYVHRVKMIDETLKFEFSKGPEVNLHKYLLNYNSKK
jgi:hypothetical protein